jgi:polyhydroxyalkanoate synthesis regulator phasin
MTPMPTIEDVRSFIQAAGGRLTPAKAQELARSIMRGEGKDKVAKTAQDLLEWSNKNRQRISELVGAEVKSQLGSLGVATRDEVEALTKRVRELERAQSGATKRTTSKRTTAKRTTAKRTTANPPASGPVAPTAPATEPIAPPAGG